MATETTSLKQFNFRPWPANSFALRQAKVAGFNLSEVLNEIVAKHLRKHIEAKAAAQTRAVRSMKPEKLATSRN